MTNWLVVKRCCGRRGSTTWKQARLRDLVAEHGEVLHRDRWREGVYERAVKEAKAVVTGDLLL